MRFTGMVTRAWLRGLQERARLAAENERLRVQLERIHEASKPAPAPDPVKASLTWRGHGR